MKVIEDMILKKRRHERNNQIRARKRGVKGRKVKIKKGRKGRKELRRERGGG